MSSVWLTMGWGESPFKGLYHQVPCLGAGDTVSQALTDALADPDHDLDSGDVVLLGTTSIRVADS